MSQELYTPLREAPPPPWARNTPMHVWVKDESARTCNWSGTWKDRKSTVLYGALEQANAQRAAKRPTLGAIRHIGIVSSGNAAMSLALLMRESEYHVHVLLTQTNEAVKRILEEVSAEVQNLQPGEWIADAETVAERFGVRLPEHLLDATMGFHDAYRTIVAEVAEQMAEPPSAMILPVGSGEALIGVTEEVAERRWPTRVIGIRKTEDPHIGGTRLDERVARFLAGRPRNLCGVMEWGSRRTAQEVVQFVPEGVRSEPAAAYPFEWFSEACGLPHLNIPRPGATPRIVPHGRDLVGDRVVIVNSGYGVLTERLEGQTE